MTHALTPCDRCHRHVRADEPACPFCAAARAVPSRFAVAAVVGAALVGALAGDAKAQGAPPRMGIEHMPAQGYGGPPHDPRLFGIEAPPPAPVTPAPEGPAVAVSLQVVVSVEGADARTARSLRAAILRRSDALRGCRERAGTPLVRAERRMWSLRPAVPFASAGTLDPVARCILSTLYRAVGGVARAGEAVARVELRFSPRGVVRVGAERDRCAGVPEPGCRRTGCPGGFVCDTRVSCVPSSCGCDPRTGQQVCTSDCGGGVCVPAPR